MSMLIVEHFALISRLLPAEPITIHQTSYFMHRSAMFAYAL